MNERRRLIKNTGIIAIGNISTKLVSFFLLPLYTAVLSTAEYGAYDYIISIATFCVPFVSVLMDESIFRFLIDCKTELDKKKIISTAVMIVAVGMTLFTVLGIPIMEGLHYSYTVYAIMYILLTVICGMLSALLRGIGRTDQFAFFNFLLGSLQIVLNVVFVAVLKLGLQGMLLASVLAQLIVATIFVLKIKLWKFINIKCVEISLAKEMIVYSFPLIPNKVSWTIINLSDRIILMNMIGSEATMPMLMLPSAFLSPLITVLSPRFSAGKVLEDQAMIRRKTGKALHVVGLIGIPSMVILILTGSQLGEVLYHNPMVGNHIPMLSLITLTGFYYAVLECVLESTGLQKRCSVLTVLASLAGLCCTLILGGAFSLGIWGFLCGELLSSLIGCSMTAIWVKKYTQISFRIGNWIGRPLFASVVSGAFARLLLR